MDKIKKYQNVVIAFLHFYNTESGGNQPDGNVNRRILVDRDNNSFQLLSIGWSGKHLRPNLSLRHHRRKNLDAVQQHRMGSRGFSNGTWGGQAGYCIRVFVTLCAAVFGVCGSVRITAA